MQYQMSIIRDLIHSSVARGADFHELCRVSGIDPQELNDAEKMVDWEYSPYLWDHAIRLTGDPLLGLHVGQDLRPTIFGMLGHLVQTCRTAGDALKAVCQFNNAVSTNFTFSLRYERDLAYYEQQPSPLWVAKYPESSRQGVELSMSGTLNAFKLITGKKIYPVKICLAYPKRFVSEYRQVFQCEVEFSSEKNLTIFKKKDLDTQVVSHDKSLFALFSSLLEEKQKKLQKHKSFGEEVKQAILSDFKGQIPLIEVMASRLNMNTRTFQRKLAAENKSFREICQETRKELALSIMKQANQKVSDVAVLLGYSDHTTFRRAFKSWTNVSPKQARKAY